MFDPGRKVYPKGKIVIIPSHGKLYKLPAAKTRDVNPSAVKIFRAITRYGTVGEIAETLGLSTVNDQTQLDRFLDGLVTDGLLSFDRPEGGAIFFKDEAVAPALGRLFIEVTRSCNLRCRHCYAEAIGDCDELDTDTLMSIIAQADALGVRQVDFTGGEAFLRKDFPELLRATSSRGMFSHLFTNGTLLDRDTCGFLASLGTIRMVYVSLDDCDSDGHDGFRMVDGAFQKTMEGIKNLKAANVPVTINLIIERRNVRRIGEIVERFRDDPGVPTRVAPVLYVGRGKCLDDGILSVEEICDAYHQWFLAQEIQHGPVEVKRVGERVGTDCGIAHSMLFIKSDGEICLCPTLTSTESEVFRFGNARTDGLERVWSESPNLHSLRNVSCMKKDCGFISACRHGCRSRAFLANGDINSIDPIPCAFFSKYGETIFEGTL